MTEQAKTTGKHPTGITPSTSGPPQPTTTATPTKPLQPTKTTPQPTKTTPQPHFPIPSHTDFLHPTPIRTFPPPSPQPGAVPFLPKETGTTTTTTSNGGGGGGTGPSSRASSVNPNDTLPPTPTSDQPQPYPPQMRIPLLGGKDIPRSTMVLPPGGEQVVRPTTQLPGVVVQSYHNALPSRPVVVAQNGYTQSEEVGRVKDDNPDEGETLLGRLGKWVEGVNSRVVETAIAGEKKGKE